MINKINFVQNYNRSTSFLKVNFKNAYRHCSSSIVSSSNQTLDKVISTDDVTGTTLTNESSHTQSLTNDASNIIIDESTLPPIPTVPVEENVSQVISTILEEGLKEPTLASQGLASWWPSGLVQRLLEIIHINFDIPWWGTIAIGN